MARKAALASRQQDREPHEGCQSGLQETQQGCDLAPPGLAGGHLSPGSILEPCVFMEKEIVSEGVLLEITLVLFYFFLQQNRLWALSQCGECCGSSWRSESPLLPRR